MMHTFALLQLEAPSTGSILALLAHGTPVSWAVLLFLLMLSAISWTIMAIKVRDFRVVRSAADPLLEYASEAASFEDVVTHAHRGTVSPMHALLRRAERFMVDTKPALAGNMERQARLSQAQVDALQMLLEKEATSERDRLERLLPWLATIGAVSPLIGLLGTVLGVAASGSGNISAVAPGVAEALIATALALTVAIPAVFGYNFFASKLNHLTSEMDGFATDVVALLVRDGRI